jgi:hypothetical protein
MTHAETDPNAIVEKITVVNEVPEPSTLALLCLALLLGRKFYA